MTDKKEAENVLEFWRAAGPSKWWKRDEGFDAKIRDRFQPLHEKAVAGSLENWLSEPASSLALILLLDQFSRNLNRNSHLAFANDGACLAITKKAISKGFDRDEDLADLRAFFYLPLMHSEDLTDQRECLKQMQELRHSGSIEAAETHLDIIERFGRFPHRNPVLGRTTTPEEQAFLDGGGFKG